MRKFTAAAAVASLLACSSLSGPAYAGDGARLGIGLGIMLLDQVVKGGSKGHSAGREPGRGDTLIGRVGESESHGSRNTSRKRNAPAAEELASLPETGPVIEFRPDPDSILADQTPTSVDDIETAATDLAPSPSSGNPEATVKRTGPVALSDEYGVFWGNVDPATADKVDQATKLGMKRSLALQALSGLPMPEDAKINAEADAATQARADAKAKAIADKAQADALAAADAKAKADKAELDALLASQKAAQKPVVTSPALTAANETASAADGSLGPSVVDTSVVPVANAPAVQVQSSGKALDLDLGATAAVKSEPAKTVEPPKKPKLDLDL